MSTWIASVNAWGEAWLTWAGASAVQSSLVIGGVLILARGLRGRVNPVWLHGLWILVLVKLVLPPTVTSPTSLGYWLPRPDLVVQSESHNETLTRVTVGVSAAPGLYDAWTGGGFSRPQDDGSRNGGDLTWRGVLAGLGLVGTMGVLGWVGRAWYRVRREIQRSRNADPNWTFVAAECATRLGLRRVPEVRVTQWLHSPAVCGLVRQVILIPEALAERLDPEERRDVLLHEMAHVRRGDLWSGMIEILLLAVYWWHPLVWVARVRLQRIREEIADAVVVVEGQRDAGRYAETLLRVAKAAAGRPMLALGFMGILESGGALRRRVEVLLEDRPRRVPRLGWTGWLALWVLALVVLPMGEGPRRAAAAEAVAATVGSTNESPRVMTLAYPVQAIFKEATPEDLETMRLMRQIRDRSLQGPGVDSSSGPGHSASTNTNPPRTDVYRVQPGRFPSYQVTLGEPADGAMWPMRDMEMDLFRGEPGGVGREAGIGDRVDVRRSGTKNGPVNLASVAAGVSPAVEPGVSPGGPGVTAVTTVLNEPKNESVASAPAGAAKPLAGNAAPPTNLVTRSFPIRWKALSEGMAAVLGKPIPDRDRSQADALREFFEAAGLNLDPPSAFVLDVRTGTLVVTAEPAAMEIVEKALEVLMAPPPMVQIEARFVSFSHPRLKELFPRGEGQFEILTAEEFRQVWQKVSQWVPVKHRSVAPRVTTLVGRQASVEQYEKLMIRHPGEAEDREESFGATLDVTPDLSSEGTRLILRLQVSQKEFLGYDEAELRRPNIAMNEARANPRIRSGETAMLSLAKPTTATFRLGEQEPAPLSNEKASSSTRVTVAFVTATFIDPAGNPLEMPEPTR